MPNSNIFKAINSGSVCAENCHSWLQDASRNGVNRRYYHGMNQNIQEKHNGVYSLILQDKLNN